MSDPTTSTTPSWWRRLFSNSFPSQFILGGLIPIVIFYGFHRAGLTLTGAIVAAFWGLGITAITYWLNRQINIFAILAATVNIIEVVGTLITRDPDFFLAGTAIDSFLYAIVFLGSLLLPRSLMQMLVEATPQSQRFSDDFRQQPIYKRAWQMVTVVWGVVYLLRGGMLVWGQINLPLEAFLTLRTFSGFPLFAILMAFSYWFPARYWRSFHTLG